jgi:hypothetical protein
MPSSGNGEQPFQVGFSEAIALTIRHLQRQASKEGRGKDFLAALRNAVDRLQTSPRAFGEPLYRLPALRMQVRCGALGPLSIDFGVCDDRPLVFIMAVKLLSGKGS